MVLIEQTGEQNGTAHGLSWNEAPGELWSDAAPGRLRKLYPQRGAESGWQAWQKRLAGGRGRQTPVSQAGKREQSPLLWALPGELSDVATEEPSTAAVREIIEQLWRIERGATASRAKSARSGPDKAPEETPAPWNDRLRQWLTGERFPVDLAYAFESLAWARALPALAATLDEGAWWGAWDKLVDLSTPSEIFSPGASPSDVLAEQLLTAELPLTLSWLFPELAAAARLGLNGWRAARRGLEQHVLGDGFLLAPLWDMNRPLLACWTRGWSIAAALRQDDSRRAIAKAARQELAGTFDLASIESPVVSRAAESTDAPDVKAEAKKTKAAARPLKPLERPPHYERFLATTLRLCRADGSQMLSRDPAGQWDRAMFAAARRLAAGAPAAEAVRASKPGKNPSNKHHKRLRSANKRRGKGRLWPLRAA